MGDKGNCLQDGLPWRWMSPGVYECVRGHVLEVISEMPCPHDSAHDPTKVGETTPLEAAIEAAAVRMHVEDCTNQDYCKHSAPAYMSYIELARAAAPILIQAGREEAAKAILDHAYRKLSKNPLWAWSQLEGRPMYEKCARLARGGDNE